MRTDKRYRITLEWCGYAEKRHVVRFCGAWVGQSTTRDGAVTLAQEFESKRY